jgi:hypothetical protein
MGVATARMPYALLGGALALAACATVARGTDWEMNPRVEAGYLTDDNYRLTPPGTEIDVQGPMADAQMEFRALNPKGEFSFTPRVRATWFPSESELDAVDYFGTLQWLRNGQRVNTVVRGEFSQQDVGDSGRVLVQNRRTRLALLPSVDYELSGRRSLEFDANLVDVSYDNEIPGAQVDFSSVDLTAGLVTHLTPISSLTVRLRGAHYDIDTVGNSNSYGGEFQWDWRTARETRAFVRGGAQNVELAVGGSKTAWLAGGGVSLLLGRHQLFADISRNVGPSSAGVIVARDQLRVNWTFDVTPRLALLAGTRGTHDEDVSSVSSYRPRSYVTSEIGMLWRWREELSLRASADYTWQKFKNSPNDPSTSSGALVSILYQPLQRRR